MKAPDAIYLTSPYPGELNNVALFEKPIFPEGTVCYLRKDALLEWAKSFTEPKIFVSTLLDKLNSM